MTAAPFTSSRRLRSPADRFTSSCGRARRKPASSRMRPRYLIRPFGACPLQLSNRATANGADLANLAVGESRSSSSTSGWGAMSPGVARVGGQMGGGAWEATLQGSISLLHNRSHFGCRPVLESIVGEETREMNTEDQTRCQCGHSANRHPRRVPRPGTPPPATARVDCLRCDCRHFTARPTPWQVVRDDVHALTVPISGPWRVASPRGVEVHRTWSHGAAVQWARSLAGIDQLLGRVNDGVDPHTLNAVSAIRPIRQRYPRGGW